MIPISESDQKQSKIERSFSNSLGTKLLRVVFGIYLLVAVFVTVVQLTSEYLVVKDSVQGEIKGFEESFAPGIALALWSFNTEQLGSILSGMNKIPSVIGVKVSDDKGQEVQAIGQILDFDGAKIKVNSNGERIADSRSILSGLISHDFDLKYTNPKGELMTIGRATIYSSTDIVVERVRYGFYMIIINSIIKSLALWIIFFIFIRRIVGAPLEKLTTATQSLNPNDPDYVYKSKALEEAGLNNRQDELGQLARAFSLMRNVIIDKIRSLEDAHENLKKKAVVELENANLQHELEVQMTQATESKKVKVLVDNMQQALFSVTSDGTIIEPVSKFTNNLFGQQIAGQNVFSVLYSGLEPSETLSAINTTFATVFGEGDLQWDLMESNLPRKINLKDSEDSSRVLKVQPTPLWDDNGLLEKIVFVVEDVTFLEKLETELSEQKSQATLIEDILANNFEDMNLFLKNSDSTLKYCQQKLEEKETKYAAEILGHLHTLKGNARVFKAKKLASQLHQSEGIILNQPMSDFIDQPAKEVVKQELEKIHDVLNSYRSLLARLLPSRDLATTTNEVEYEALSHLEQIIEGLPNDAPDKSLLRLAVKRLAFKSLKDVVSKFESMVYEIAADLKKDVNFELNGDALITPESIIKIQDCILHLLRNSVDHGLEKNIERVKNGKPRTGRIAVNFTDDFDRILIAISDDGHGIDAEKIFAIAAQKGIVQAEDATKLTEKEKIALILRPNFSSKTRATEISGRGIGMSVVMEKIKKLGGSLEIQTQVGKGSTFLISLPKFDLKNISAA